MEFTEEELTESIVSEIIETDEDTKIEDTLDDGGLYPYDVTNTDLDIREDKLTVFELIRKRKQGKFIIPDFQRNFVWKPHQKSQFIESLILNFPIPAFYFNQTVDGKLIIVDGLQRTTTLYDFLNNKFALTNLNALPELNGNYFKDLSEKQQVKIEDHNLNIYKIMPSVPLAVVYDIFNRINTGGTQLNRQEIRNCLFIGKSTELLKELASKPYFIKSIDEGISAKRMKDQEAVLRYLAFRINNYQNYGGDMSEFLENTMRQLNLMSDKELKLLEKEFEKAMRLSYLFFKEKNFRFPTPTTRGRINIALLESVAYFFADLDKKLIIKNRNQIIQNYNQLITDSIYIDAIRISTGDKKRVLIRFEKAKSILGKTI